jgi:hypothetical protein
MILNGNNLFYLFLLCRSICIIEFIFKSLFKTSTQKTIANWFLIIGISVLAVQYIIDPNVFFKFNLFEIFITSFNYHISSNTFV